MDIPTVSDNAKLHAEFLAQNLDHLGHPFVLAQLVEAERNRFAPLETAHLAFMRGTHEFLANLSRDWHVTKQGVTLGGETEPDGQARTEPKPPPTPAEFVAAQLAKLNA